MERARKAGPRVEALEGRAVPSAPARGALAAAIAASVQKAQAVPILASGTVRGSYSAASTIPDVGAVLTIDGRGRMSPLGSVKIHGTTQGPGFVSSGRADGSLIVSNGRGSVTLIVEGPWQDGAAGLPPTFQYIVSGGTGAYRGATGTGIVSVVTKPQSGGVTPSGGYHGTLTLSFQPDR